MLQWRSRGPVQVEQGLERDVMVQVSYARYLEAACLELCSVLSLVLALHLL
jgi:hypothetical protein